MGIREFVSRHDVDFSLHMPDAETVTQMAAMLSVSVGPELLAYLTGYGYLGFKSVEFYGLNASQGMDSDMVRQTRYLHHCFPLTKDYIAVRNMGDGVYVLINSDDFVFRFFTDENRMEHLGEKLFDYVLRCFRTELI